MMIFGACVLLVGSYAIYVSFAPRKPWSPVPEGGGSLEPTSVSVAQPPPAQLEQPTSSNVEPPPKDIGQQSFRPNGVIDVPRVGVRSVPDIAWKITIGDLRRGERVEILKKISGSGPTWARIKTKSGKIGWVFASVVKERKGG